MLKSEGDDLYFQSYLGVIGHPHPFSIHGSLAPKCSRQLWKPAKSLTLYVLIFSLCLKWVRRFEKKKNKNLVGILIRKHLMEVPGERKRRPAPPAPVVWEYSMIPPQRSFGIPSVTRCAVELTAHKCDGSQRCLAVQMKAELSQVPLLHILFSPGNHVPCSSA